MGLKNNTPLPDDKPKCTWTPNADASLSPHPKFEYPEHGKIKPDVLSTIGETPLIKLNKIPKAFNIKCDMYAKCEFLNPGGSVKDRIAYRMIEEAERTGVLKPGSVIIEATAGNTGIGLALVATLKGYRCIMVMPDRTSTEKLNTLKALGSEIVLVAGGKACDAPEGVFGVAQQMERVIPNGIILDQFRNYANPIAHYDTTAMELYRQCDGKIDMVVNGAGTGGTLTGIGRKLKELVPSCIMVGADPAGSQLAKLLSDDTSDTDVSVEIEGIGRDFVPTVLDNDVVTKWVKVADQESFEMSRRLIKDEGLLCGGSSGTSMVAALKAAVSLNANQRCVVILPDTMQNYLTKHLSDQWMESKDFKDIPERPELWWWNIKVCTSAIVKKDLNIKSNATCKEAIELMEKRNCEYLAVVHANGSLAGVISMLGIMKNHAEDTLKMSDEVGKVPLVMFSKVSTEDSIGKASRILEVEEFVLVAKQCEQNSKDVIPIGMINRIDVMKFVMSK